MSADTRIKNIEFYTSLLEKHGVDARSLNWGSEQSQQARFKVLAEIGDISATNILDVGCGLGDFYQWLNQHNRNVNFSGIDITPGMIELASERFKDSSFAVASISDLDKDEMFDFVFASGIFYLVEEDPLQNMQAIIGNMFARCKKGIAFNSLSTWATEQTPGEFYASPAETIDFCKTLSPYVVLRHDYHPADFTVYIYKDKQQA